MEKHGETSRRPTISFSHFRLLRPTNWEGNPAMLMDEKNSATSLRSRDCCWVSWSVYLGGFPCLLSPGPDHQESPRGATGRPTHGKPENYSGKKCWDLFLHLQPKNYSMTSQFFLVRLHMSSLFCSMFSYPGYPFHLFTGFHRTAVQASAQLSRLGACILPDQDTSLVAAPYNLPAHRWGHGRWKILGSTLVPWFWFT